VPTGLLGVALSFIALEWGSIVPSMLAHFLNNACLVVLVYTGSNDSATQMSRGTQIGLFAGGLAVSAVGAALLRDRSKSPSGATL